MPWIAVPIWHGTSEEALALITAVDNNCPNKVPCLGCDAHKAMLDQRWLNHVVFLRRIRERLLREEGLKCKSVRLARTQ